MAIQITGSFKNGYASYTDPQLQLIPHLTQTYLKPPKSSDIREL